MAGETWWADYSSGKLSAAVLKQHGYTGVIRYIDSPDRLDPPGRLPKHTNRQEYADHTRNGLRVWLVYQNTTTDADGGHSAGVAAARRAKAGADWLGYPTSDPIFFCNDRPSLPSAASWRAYLDGAASVLGKGRVGAYGFYNAMDAAIGHASWFWQAGRRSDIRPHVHFWQDNNNQPVVGGIATDRNLLLKAIGGGGAAPGGDDDMDAKQFLALIKDPAVIEQMHVNTWGGKFVPLHTDREDGRREYPETQLFSLRERLTREQFEPIRRQVAALTELVGKQGGASADEIAAALRAGLVADLLPVLREVLRDALEDDNGEQADAISDAVLSKLGEKLNPEGSAA